MKKIICSVLIILLVIQMSFSGVFAVEDNILKMEKDVLGSDGLGIIPFADQATVTRENMIDIIINLIQIEADTESDVYDVYTEKLSAANDYDWLEEIYSKFGYNPWVPYNPFSDWYPDDEKMLLIDRLYETKIIKGNGDGTFRPKDNCTYAEAIAFIVRALGHEMFFYTDDNDPTISYVVTEGYPARHIEKAQELQIISKDDFIDPNSAIAYNDVVDIVFKSLFTDRMKRADDAYYHDIMYITAPCPLEGYHNLNYKYGDAVADKDGITISDEKFYGEVYQNPDFDSGKVLCIYKKGEVNEIVICVEVLQ